MNISLNSEIGIKNPITMKLVGMIREEEIIIMIDPETTNNFISTLVQKLRITCEECKRWSCLKKW